MTGWWKNLSVRERIMVALGFICGLLFLLYQLVILPLGGWHVNAKSRLSAAELGYEQVILAARLHGGQSVGVSADSAYDTTTPLKTALEASATEAGILVSTTDGNDNRVQISLAAANPQELYAWMRNVETRYGAVIVEARISRARNNNQLVKTDRLTFMRRGQ